MIISILGSFLGAFLASYLINKFEPRRRGPVVTSEQLRIYKELVVGIRKDLLASGYDPSKRKPYGKNA